MKYSIAISLFVLIKLSFGSFLVKPYLQLGTGFFENGKEQRTLIFEMEIEDKDIKVVLKDSKGKELNCDLQSSFSRFNSLFYKALFKDLESGENYRYQVFQKGKSVFYDQFKTASKDSPVELAVFGCGGEDTKEQKEIAGLIKSRSLGGVVYLGDFSYATKIGGKELRAGTVKGFRQNFFKPYEEVFSKIPFYPVIGNKEMDSSNFDTDEDAYAYFDYVCHPLNGPETMPLDVLKGREDRKKIFLEKIPHYKRGTNYSFDLYKDGKVLVHFQVVDGNAWMNPNQEGLRSWMERDLKETKAPWKIACVHQPLASCTQRLKPFEFILNQPGINLGDKKQILFNEIKKGMLTEKNRVRQYAKVWQENGVQLVFNAHLHGYERSKPLELIAKDKVLDDCEKFEEKTGRGPVYIISGAAGAHLHLNALINSYLPPEKRKMITPEMLQFCFSQFLDYTEKINLVDYSFSTLKIDHKKLTFEQITKAGVVIDSFSINL